MRIVQRRRRGSRPSATVRISLCMRIEPPRLRVLTVDDQPEVLAGVVAVLALEFEVQAASDVDRAWRLLQQQPFDVLCTDLAMGATDGLALIRKVATLALPPACVLVTARHELRLGPPDPRVRVTRLFKPYEPRVLLQMVRNAAASRSER
jgi:CheY-like chemotaxis protein